MNKDIYIHIGLPRAGSTFLQDKVFNNLPHDKVCYNPKEISQELLPEFMRFVQADNLLTDERVNQLSKDIESVFERINQKKILISNEGLCGLDFKLWQNTDVFFDVIKKLFPKAKILIVLRNQVEWIESLYYLSIKYGYLVPFNEFINYSSKNGFESEISNFWTVDVFNLDFNRLINTYKNDFKLYVLNFDDLIKHPEEYINKFEQILGEKIITFPKIEKVNQGMTKGTLKISGVISQVLFYKIFWKERIAFLPRYRNLTKLQKVQWKMLRLYYHLILKISPIVSLIFYKENPTFLTSSQKEIINEYYKEKNRMINYY